MFGTARLGAILAALIFCLLIYSEAGAIGRAGGRAAAGVAAARSNPGAARANVAARNLDIGRSRAEVSRPGAGRGQSNIRTARPLPGVSDPPGNVARPGRNRPQPPGRGIPPVGGGSSRNRPDLNRPGGNRPGANRPDLDRPELNRPAGNRPGANRPGQDRPDADRPGLGVQPLPERIGTRPGLPNRPGAGGQLGDRPEWGTRLPNRPLAPDQPSIGAFPRPDRPVAGDTPRPDLSSRFGSRPSRDQLHDFLGLDRPSEGRPGVGERPEVPRRPDVGNWPGPAGRPGWGELPDRPFVRGGDNRPWRERPRWANLDPERLTPLRERWTAAITDRRDNGWRQRRPERIARWRPWADGVRLRWWPRRWDLFGPSWWARHRLVFWGWHHWQRWDRYTWFVWWQRPTFVGVTNWFQWETPSAVWDEPIFFDYGDDGNVVFEDDRVIVNGTDVGSYDEFAQSAADLADVPPPSDEAAAYDAEWMALGTFAVMVSQQEVEPTRFIQMAVNREGIISGTYFNQQTEYAQAVLGQVDKQTQRVAVRLSDDDDLVAETGLYNLTLDEAPLLVHMGAEQSELFLLVRLDAPDSVDPRDVPQDDRNSEDSAVEDSAIKDRLEGVNDSVR